jgi:hypothetical protein
MKNEDEKTGIIFFWIEAKKNEIFVPKLNSIGLQLVMIEEKTKFHSWKGLISKRNEQYWPTTSQDRSENELQ